MVSNGSTQNNISSLCSGVILNINYRYVPGCTIEITVCMMLFQDVQILPCLTTTLKLHKTMVLVKQKCMVVFTIGLLITIQQLIQITILV